MAEPTYKFEDVAGRTFELTGAEVVSKVFAHRNVQHTQNLTPEDLRGVLLMNGYALSWFGLWPQDHEALKKLREIEGCP